jgi:tryptophanyl-tRNA synthetase
VVHNDLVPVAAAVAAIGLGGVKRTRRPAHDAVPSRISLTCLAQVLVEASRTLHVIEQECLQLAIEDVDFKSTLAALLQSFLVTFQAGRSPAEEGMIILR